MWPFKTSPKQSYEPVKTEEVDDSENSFDLDADVSSPTSRKPKGRRRFPNLIGLLCFVFVTISLIGVGIVLTSHNISWFSSNFTPDQPTASPTAVDEALEPTPSPTTPTKQTSPAPPSQVPSSSVSTPTPPTQSTSPDDSDTNPCHLRREWRTLTRPQQQSYITAVQCLLRHPSQLPPPYNTAPNSTLYTDFPFIHGHHGYSTHNSAAFLPWHRYFLHLYSLALADHCDYTDPLPYWDWTLDAKDLSQSPVFDPATGFGGNGDLSLPVTLGNSGRCVTDGPFGSGEGGVGVWGIYYDVKYQPHCLSRGFRNDQGEGSIDASDVSPASIEEVLSLDKYEEFVRRMEEKVHDAIPFGVGGDFETFTAPYDPLFYLHHTQLDRLWSLWQNRDPMRRLEEYNGHAARHSMEMAHITDKITYGKHSWHNTIDGTLTGPDGDIEVWQVMDTQGLINGGDWTGVREGWTKGEGVRVHTPEKGLGKGVLCYRYE